jgi:hypothetical protein
MIEPEQLYFVCWETQKEGKKKVKSYLIIKQHYGG